MTEWLIVVQHKVINCSSKSWREHFDDDVDDDDDDDDDDDVCFVLHQHLCWIFIVLPHENNSLRVDMSLKSNR
jgi:hypothetical protein